MYINYTSKGDKTDFKIKCILETLSSNIRMHRERSGMIDSTKYPRGALWVIFTFCLCFFFYLKLFIMYIHYFYHRGKKLFKNILQHDPLMIDFHLRVDILKYGHLPRETDVFLSTTDKERCYYMPRWHRVLMPIFTLYLIKVSVWKLHFYMGTTETTPKTWIINENSKAIFQ